jgi:apolipoprotein N-acyltransferase
MLPPINREALDIFDRLATPENDTLSAKRAHDAVAELAREHHLALLVGADYFADWTIRHDSNGDYWVARDRRNTAYFFDQKGNMDDSLGKRYDKIHLVPFGEFIPFKKSLPFLYRILVSLGPKYYEDYELQPGDENALTVFNLASAKGNWRFVTPICFEDIDANICRAMFRPTDGGGKRADFLVNLTNDGWFKANENNMHLQASIFRCIENRAPMVRSVNTGISGFIDSTGRTGHLLSPRTAGWSAQQLMIDRRVTFYTRFGDWFAAMCLVVMVLILAKSMLAKKVLEPMS